MSASDVQRAITRMAHEIAERNRGLEHLVLIGLQTGGVPIAQRLAASLESVENTTIPVGILDVAVAGGGMTRSLELFGRQLGPALAEIN